MERDNWCFAAESGLDLFEIEGPGHDFHFGHDNEPFELVFDLELVAGSEIEISK